MDALSGTLSGIQSFQLTSSFARFTRTEDSGGSIIRDTVEFGSTTLTLNQSTEVVLERVFEKLRAVVDDARAELGLGPGQETDLSAEATAGRIVDFALGAFGTFQNNHPELEGTDARSAFAEFIGAAIEQGISEARSILGALSALTGEADSNINSISDIIAQRLQEFVMG